MLFQWHDFFRVLTEMLCNIDGQGDKIGVVLLQITSTTHKESNKDYVDD